MLPEQMLAWGYTRNCIREVMEYGTIRKQEIGAENVYDYSIGNPSIPAPDCVNEAIAELIRGDSVALHGYTTAAGPVELRISQPSYGYLMDIMRRTRLGDAHRMGLHIMYSDLVNVGAREENWYRRIAGALNDRYPENVIAYGP